MGSYIVSRFKKVLFRADAKPEIGIGDLMSLIHLSKYFEADGWTTFFMIRSYPAALKLVERYEIEHLKIIESSISIPEEVATINQFLLDNDIDLVFFEITENRLSDYTGITSDVYKACVSFDGYILPDMDLVVDWDVEAEKYFQPQKYPDTKFLLGPEYVILPFDFDMKRVAKRAFNIPPKRLLICMGGADEFNLTCKIVNALIEQKNKMHITIIIGSGYEYREELEHCLKNSELSFEIKENISNMFEEYMACDVAIGTGGLTSSELVATRTTAFLIAAYQHQEARCRYFDEKGWAIYLGNRNEWKKDFSIIFNKKMENRPSACFNTKAIVMACNGFADQ